MFQMKREIKTIAICLFLISCNLQSNEEVILKGSNFYKSQENSLKQIVEIIKQTDCCALEYSITYHMKNSKIYITNTTSNKGIDCFNYEQKRKIESLLLNTNIRSIAVTENDIYFSLNYRTKELIYWGLMYLNDKENLTDFKKEIVSFGSIPKGLNDWIYPINEHWYIYVPKKRGE